MIELPLTTPRLSGKTHLVRRIIAFLFDYGLFLAAAFQYANYIGVPDPIDPDVLHVPTPHMVVMFFAWCFCFPILEATLGFTLGKGLLDLKVATTHGGKLDVVRSFKRRLLDPVDFMGCFPLPGFLAVLLTPNGQRLGDLWAKSVVVHEKELSHDQPA